MITHMSDLMKRALLNGGANDTKLRPHALQIIRHRKNDFQVYIVNSDNEKLVLIADFALLTGNTATLVDVHRVFEFTLR